MVMLDAKRRTLVGADSLRSKVIKVFSFGDVTGVHAVWCAFATHPSTPCSAESMIHPVLDTQSTTRFTTPHTDIPWEDNYIGIWVGKPEQKLHIRNFHAIYGKDEGQIGLSPLALIEGKLSSRALGLAIEWAALHQRELLENWELMRTDQPPRKIPPLK